MQLAIGKVVERSGRRPGPRKASLGRKGNGVRASVIAEVDKPVRALNNAGVRANNRMSYGHVAAIF